MDTVALLIEGIIGQTSNRPNRSTAQAYPNKILSIFQSA